MKNDQNQPGNVYQNAPGYPQNQQTGNPQQSFSTRLMSERLPEEKKQMAAYLEKLNTMLVPTTSYAAVVRELLLEQLDNAEYLLLKIDPKDNVALYGYLMGMIFWYRGYQTEAGQHFYQASQDDPNMEVFRETYQYQWGDHSGGGDGKTQGRDKSSCCSGADCCECLSCCSDLSRCFGSC